MLFGTWFANSYACDLKFARRRRRRRHRRICVNRSFEARATTKCSIRAQLSDEFVIGKPNKYFPVMSHHPILTGLWNQAGANRTLRLSHILRALCLISWYVIFLHYGFIGVWLESPLRICCLLSPLMPKSLTLIAGRYFIFIENDIYLQILNSFKGRNLYLSGRL